jgi:tripartite-type tricarboxylate transporter receptor subunit TctC
MLPLPSNAQDWPGGAVEVVVPYAPGGAADVMGRVFMDAIGTKLGHTFVIKNTAGAGGLLAARQVARATPDGRTLIISGAASHLLAPLMNPDANMDPVKEFTHIAYFGGAPSVLVVHPSTGVRTMQDFLAYVRAQKESVGYVSPGVGTGGHITATYLAEKEKLNLVHVPHKGGGTAILDVVAGHVKVASMNWSTAREHVLAGSLTAIAITSSKRVPDQPELRTFKELGYDELVMATWYGLSGPAGLPDKVVATLNKAAIDSINEPRVKRQLELEAAEPKTLSPREFSAFIADEMKRWGPITSRLRQ